MAGRLIYLMGPSGAGKDTLLNGVMRLMGSRAYLAPRVITREADRTAEGALTVTLQEFHQMEEAGLLAMSWRAHGFAYGVLQQINERMAAGKDVFVNGSRAYLPTAVSRYRDLVPVMVDVDPCVLHERLRYRGRETDMQIQERLARNVALQDVPAGLARPMVRIDNSGTPEDAVRSLYRQLEQQAALIAGSLCA
ncbi:phosphonate metabolism protein/1,5-bisphosphokinase (PRPP-forming) PhnN [Pollutimonas thiosulfatoxidans]|uniref:Ribose 1,5-bisphosphate phosphokinase PhnN n=1 Tax=Pollutimonas thiosulfatoxidans TaxID=2028345 RepID=A0A410GFJ9_9BURK|nr:phosphonate metabolism protein/1,5-bisphosphokinase (PRPP-forming) PhnN [Pollutimonas thiosulfatoxidans]MBF6615787.1 phosphonate metabolism protein/1,5-bisphosphokinase (PRPP-forming) PhnN [Candidimonas sp.]QAA95082.1 phosphonate metabolism protein/1,5-bisphosphokinase (PRPP-forming) PhnN [Pollutimonas thiosulfatoxidans]